MTETIEHTFCDWGVWNICVIIKHSVKDLKTIIKLAYFHSMTQYQNRLCLSEVK